MSIRYDKGNSMKKIMLVLSIALLAGCAPKVKDVDANRIHVGLTKLTYDGTVYACHEIRQGEELTLMCRKAQNRSR